MKVLVTGGCGLIGFHAAKYYAEQGHEVDVMDNLERSELLGHGVTEARRSYNRDLLENYYGVPVWVWDVSREDDWIEFEGHDVVIHMAGQCGVPTSIDNPRRDFEINTVGTLNALEYARRHDATLVLASTNKVYPIHSGFMRKDARWRFEDMKLHNFGVGEDVNFIGARTPYGNSKMSADLLCQEWAYTYGVRTGVFRMSCIYGPNQFGFSEQGWATWFIIAILKGWPLTIYGDGYQVRDMLYVEDCVAAYDAFVRSDKQHGVYNLGGGIMNTLSLHEHLRLVTELTEKYSELSFSDWRPLDQKCYVSDIRKIQNELGWSPGVSISDGIEEVVEWVQQNLDLF